MYACTITRSYIELRSLYVGAEALRDPNLNAGRVTLLIENVDDFSAEGSLNSQGYLSGMAKLYRRLGLSEGTVVEFTVQTDGSILVHSPVAPTATTTAPPQPPVTTQSVFQQQRLKHLHIEPFRAENLDNWEPETEPDVYLAFGVLQDFTDFQYCCGASASLLRKLGANYDESSKPDAILIDRTTGEYLMAEWKKHSSDFKLNHSPSDVDVLVCWHDNETDRDKLPPNVLALHAVAKTAAESALSG